MGGKVAMQLATQHPDEIGNLIIVDIAPKAYARRTGPCSMRCAPLISRPANPTAMSAKFLP
jgi:pimeloyl-ACP methyl ester carboxylesterase